MIKPSLCALLLAALTLTGCVASSPKPTPKLVITTASLPGAPVGTAYSQQIAVTGGTAPYTYSATGLPVALSIASDSGLIAGTPAQSAIGTATVVVTVTDTSTPQQTATATYSLAVTPSTLAIATTALPTAIVDTPYTAVLAASGGVTPYAYAASGLPAGLSINATTGAITGNAALSAVGTHSVQFTVTDAATTPQTATATLTIKVVPAGLAITTTTLPEGVVNYPYAFTLAAASGTPPYTFAATGLPTSLTLNAANGAITGTPASSDAGTVNVTFTVTDSGAPAQQASTQLPLTIDAANSAAACKNISLGDGASLNGFVPFPAASAWNTDISAAPVDTNSAAITSASEFAGHFLHPDFSSVVGGNYGIPYTVVDSGSTPLVSIAITDYASESDVALAPIPATAPIEGSPADCDGWPNTYLGDAHVLVLDRATCTLYETFNTHRCTAQPGLWSASQQTLWNLLTDEQRPWTWTSADAAGLAILPGLVRYDEVASGAIHHAIRFTMPDTLARFIPPATHQASNSTTTLNAMGMRIRLKAGFDISSFSRANQVILTAMKKYGLILADNGSAFYFQGAPDARWDDNDLNELKAVSSDNFEVVQTTPGYPGYTDSSAPTGAAPTINSFNATATTVAAGTPVTLTWSVTGASYNFIDQLGGMQGSSVVVRPTATTTYTLNSTSQYGRTQASITITVN